MKSLEQILLSKQNKTKAEQAQRFFKTGPGQYGEGDKFLGITVPELRAVAKKFPDLSLVEIKKLLENPWHEIRLAGIFILTKKFSQADSKSQKTIFTFYLKNRRGINNWDLVDSSAAQIVGVYTLNNPTELKKIWDLARSKNMRDRRIAIVATQAHIRAKTYDTAIAIATELRNDTHDLMHKAVGWTLRELGKRNRVALEKFLEQHGSTLPRTLLRYAIEHFSPTKRKYYLNLKA